MKSTEEHWTLLPRCIMCPWAKNNKTCVITHANSWLQEALCGWTKQLQSCLDRELRAISDHEILCEAQTV